MGQYFKAVNVDTKKSLHPHDFENGAKLMEHSWVGNNFVRCVEGLISSEWSWFGHKLIWAWDYADPIKWKTENWYSTVEKNEKLLPNLVRDYRFLLNHTKWLYVDKSILLSNDDWLTIHPLPLLTCESNGRWGGDYSWKDGNNLVWSWCWDCIEASNTPPNQEIFSKVTFFLIEA